MGYVVQDESGLPISCPSLFRVLGYEQSMRDVAWKVVTSSNYTFKAGLEAAMADADTRILNFTTGFSMEANSAACRRLSAPGLQEIYANLPRQVAEPPAGTKRPDPPAGGAATPKKKSRNRGRPRTGLSWLSPTEALEAQLLQGHHPQRRRSTLREARVAREERARAR